MNWHTRGETPNPYRAAVTAYGEQETISAMRERLAIVETRVEHLATQSQVHSARDDRLADRMANLEQIGRDALINLPVTIQAQIAPLQAELTQWRTGWLATLQPLVLKVLTALAVFLLALLFKWATGKSLDLSGALSAALAVLSK